LYDKFRPEGTDVHEMRTGPLAAAGAEMHSEEWLCHASRRYEERVLDECAPRDDSL
jgi:hypothetical protein